MKLAIATKVKMFACLLSQFWVFSFGLFPYPRSEVCHNKRTEWFVQLLVLFVDGKCTLLLKCVSVFFVHIFREYVHVWDSRQQCNNEENILILQFVYSSVILLFCIIYSIKWLYYSKLNTLSGPLCSFQAVICLWNYPFHFGIGEFENEDPIKMTQKISI